MTSLSLPKWSDVLIGLYLTSENKRYCQKLSRNVKASINHIRVLVKKLETAKLVKIIPTKKIKRIYLTEKGENVASAILAIKSEID